MSSVAQRLAPLDRATGRTAGLRLPLAVAGLAALVVFSVLLRSRALRAGFWLDEGLAVGIASFPLAEIPTVLRQDGSPPLYYLLLHVWMVLAGEGEAATHSLSALCAALTVPAAWWAARRPWGARAAWIAALLATAHPFLTFYAQETRMYALVVLLGTVLTGALVRAFVLRDRRLLAPFAAAATLVLYTHTWGLFLVAGAACAVALCWFRAGPARRGLAADGAIAFGAVALLYAPWVPSLLFQIGHTGAPWGTRPAVDELGAGALTALGGGGAAVLLAVAAGAGIWMLIGARRGRERDRDTAALLPVLALAAATLALAWLSSQVAPAWTSRYLAVAVGPALLAAAVGLSAARRAGLAVLGLVTLLWATQPADRVVAKSNARTVTAGLSAAGVGSGDLVVSTHPEQVAVLRYYLGDGPRYASALGPVADARVMDWRDAGPRLARAAPGPVARRLVAGLEPGRDLALVVPILRSGDWRGPWTSLVRRRTVQWERVLDAHPRLERRRTLPRFGAGAVPRGVRAIVYRVRAAPPR